MRRRLTPFVQVAFGLLASTLSYPTALLAQHIGLGAPASPSHIGLGAPNSPSHIGLGAPSLPSPARPSGLPSGPMALRPGVRYPSVPIHDGSHPPSTATGPSHRPDDGRHGADYRNHTPYIYTGYTWLNPYGYGFPVAYGGLPYAGQDDAGGGPQLGPQQADYGEQPPADHAPEPPAPQMADNALPSFRPAYEGPAVDAPVSPQPATTLIFKDGRPAVQIHNYALTANTLYALDGDSRQEIPLSLLNVQATVDANRAAGVDFALPTSR
jgi:hypothetical protein